MSSKRRFITDDINNDANEQDQESEEISEPKNDIEL